MSGEAEEMVVATDTLLSGSQLKGTPVYQVGPQVPGLVMFAGLAWAVCQHQDQTRILCSTSQPLPWRLVPPQRPACEGRKLGCSVSLPTSLSVMVAGLGWAGVDGSVA